MATSLQRELHYLRVETALHLETKKEEECECECECECLGVKKFKMVRCNGFFVVADGSELGMLAVVMTGWGRGKKQLQMRPGSCIREKFDSMKYELRPINTKEMAGSKKF